MMISIVEQDDDNNNNNHNNNNKDNIKAKVSSWFDDYIEKTPGASIDDICEDLTQSHPDCETAIRWERAERLLATLQKAHAALKKQTDVSIFVTELLSCAQEITVFVATAAGGTIDSSASQKSTNEAAVNTPKPATAPAGERYDASSPYRPPANAITTIAPEPTFRMAGGDRNSDDESQSGDIGLMPLPEPIRDAVLPAFERWSGEAVWQEALQFLHDMRDTPELIDEVADVHPVAHSLMTCVVNAVVDVLEEDEGDAGLRARLALFLETNRQSNSNELRSRARAALAITTQGTTARVSRRTGLRNSNRSTEVDQPQVAVLTTRNQLSRHPDASLFWSCVHGNDKFTAHSAARAVVSIEWKRKCTRTYVKQALQELTRDFVATLHDLPNRPWQLFGVFGDGLRFHGVSLAVDTETAGTAMVDKLSTLPHRLAKCGESWNSQSSRETVLMIASVIHTALHSSKSVVSEQPVSTPAPAVVDTSRLLLWHLTDGGAATVPNYIFAVHNSNDDVVALFSVTELLRHRSNVTVFRAKWKCLSESFDKFQEHHLSLADAREQQLFTGEKTDVVWKLRGINRHAPHERYNSEIAKFRLLDSHDRRNDIVELVVNLGDFGMLMSWCGTSLEQLHSNPGRDLPVCMCSDKNAERLTFLVADRAADLIKWLQTKGLAWNDIHPQNVLVMANSSNNNNNNNDNDNDDDDDDISIFFADVESVWHLKNNDDNSCHGGDVDDVKNRNEDVQRTPDTQDRIYHHKGLSPPKSAAAVCTPQYDWFCLAFLLEWMMSHVTEPDKARVMDKCYPTWRNQTNWSTFDGDKMLANLFKSHGKQKHWQQFLEKKNNCNKL